MINSPEEFNIKEIKGKEPADFGFKEPKKKRRIRKKHLFWALVAVGAVVLAIAALTVLKGWFSFSKDKVELQVMASIEIASGEEIEFFAQYKNNNRVALNDVRLIIDYPQGAYSLEGSELMREEIRLEDILPKQENSKKFKLRLAGEKGSIKAFSVRLNYSPVNISSRFENSTVFKVNISSVLVGLYLTVPQKAINGEEVFYILDYLNNIEEDLSDLKIELSYPSGFSFKSAEPLQSPEGNNVWQIKELKKGERGTIKVSGILGGVEGENKILTASIGKIEEGKILRYSQASGITQISSSPLLVSLFLNNNENEINVSAGQGLEYTIKFKNNTDIALSQLILKAYLVGEVLDFKNLKLREKGFFDSLNNVISWSAAGVPSLALLAPGDLGEVSFRITLKDNFSINNFDDKNFKISISAELETLNVPPQFNLERLKMTKTLESRVNSKVVLRAKGYYNETMASIINFGPIPPKVNTVTTYTIHWQITNASNDLENVRVSAILPEGIEWRSVYTPLGRDARLEYNERTKQITWTIKNLPAGTGYLMPVYELVFQIALRPSLIQIETLPVLIDESKLEGKDVFTGEILEVFSSALATDLPDDTSVGFSEGKVVE